MQLEHQCCSLVLAKKLQELGVNQQSIFYWILAKTSANFAAYGLTYITNIFDRKENFDEIYSAFTVAELGEMLRYWVTTRKHRDSDWLCRHHYMEYEHDTKAETEANARAKMLIYLLENKLISVPS